MLGPMTKQIDGTITWFTMPWLVGAGAGGGWLVGVGWIARGSRGLAPATPTPHRQATVTTCNYGALFRIRSLTNRGAARSYRLLQLPQPSAKRAFFPLTGLAVWDWLGSAKLAFSSNLDFALPLNSAAHPGYLGVETLGCEHSQPQQSSYVCELRFVFAWSGRKRF